MKDRENRADALRLLSTVELETEYQRDKQAIDALREQLPTASELKLRMLAGELTQDAYNTALERLTNDIEILDKREDILDAQHERQRRKINN